MTVTQSGVAGVLIVEDDRSLAELYAEWLEGTYDVATAYGGAAALERLDSTVDVVLLDRMMPGRSGGEVLETIRASEFDPQVVMVSAVTPDLDVVQMGFDAYLEKPVDAAVLRETLDRMLTRAEYDEKLRELFSLIERQDALEAVKSAEVLRKSEEYQSLTERLEAVQTEVEALLVDLPGEDFRVAVERLQRTVAERTNERRYESLTEDVLDESREATVVVDADGSVVWANEATERLLGVDRDDIHGRDYGAVARERLADVEAGDESLVSLVQDGLSRRADEVEATVHVPADGERTERWLEYRGTAIRTGLYAGGWVEHYHDISIRHRREQYLRALHRATRDLMAADTIDAVAERAVAAATADLEFPYAAVFTRDEATGTLVPTAHEGETPDLDPELPTLSGGDDPVWTTFVGRTEPLDAETHRAHDGADGWLDAAFRDWLLCPLGQQGVFLLAAADGRSLSGARRSLAETWAANTRQALKQAARTRKLLARDRELERRNEQLSRLDRINRLIRSITPAVVSTDTHAEVEAEVCRRVLDVATVRGSWIADVDLSTGATVCRASAGDLDAYLANVPQAGSEPPTAETAPSTPAVPARRAYESESPVSVTDLLTVDPGVWWRDRGLNGGTNSIVAVPIVHESVCFGVVEVHLDQPGGMVEEEVDAFSELGATIGHAIGALRRRDALLTGGSTALTFRIDSESTLSRFVTDVDAPVSATDVSRRDSGTCAVFVTLDLGPDQNPDGIGARTGDHPGVSVIRADPGRVTCVVTLNAESPLQQLISHGAALRDVEVETDSGASVVTVTIPYETGVREYVDAVTEALTGIELVSKRYLSVDWQSEPAVAAAVDSTLTERQRETLRMAFHAGYFDWPRSVRADAVAEELGIVQSTFSQHLRTAERKLLAELFS
ncbi:helix-turn-helix domain-containing protein [Halobellus ruber]|uniref:Helix-turn-helix domain-containing protein n=1 Tax=Halobellus ruber TaxID=2761102 RepID=A0A7J9SMG2_9EURY|nr:helix-turn-helix domain-containing protein [Halobellus ruber]MBB6646241.1 helix-turn-helix domain-containing protein [Halobellus ruber]